MDSKNYFIIDAHCDTMCKLLKEGGTLQENPFHISLKRVSGFGGYVQLFAAWVDDAAKEPLKEALALIDTFYCKREAAKESVHPIFEKKDLRKALFGGKVGAMLTLENGNALEGSLEVLRTLYRLGVRAVTLTWNGKNELACGSVCDEAGGLTEFGREVVREMNRLGMLIDVSHLSEQGFWEVLSLSEQPVMASHSNARFITEHKRNLQDDQIRALVERGGFIGLNLYPVFLGKDGKADMSDCLRHIEHMLTLGAEDILGLGSDFDGVDCLPNGISGPEDYGNLFDLLLQKGYSAAFVEKLSHKNFLRFAEGILV